MWSGVPQLLMMPVAAVCLRWFDARVLLTLGLALLQRQQLHEQRR
jgi:hypothetical protein